MIIFFFFFLVKLQIDYLIRTEGGLSNYLYECKFLSLPEPGSDDGLLTPDSVLEPTGSARTSSGSGGSGGVGCRTTLVCTATTEFVRKKRSSTASSAYRTICRPACSPVSEISAGLMNRRKGNPQRAPLYWICVRNSVVRDGERGKGGEYYCFLEGNFGIRKSPNFVEGFLSLSSFIVLVVGRLCVIQIVKCSPLFFYKFTMTNSDKDFLVTLPFMFFFFSFKPFFPFLITLSLF